MFIQPNTQITLQQFRSISNSLGAFKTYTDWVVNNWTSLRFNNEILGSPIIKPIEILGDNIGFENLALGQVREFNDDLQTIVFNTPKYDRLVMKLTDTYTSNYKYSYLDKKSAADWSNLLGTWFQDAYKLQSDTNNWLSMETLTDYCVATGQYIILPEISTLYFAGATNTDWIYKQATKILALETNKIVNSRSIYNLGQPKENIRWLEGWTEYDNTIAGVNYFSSANLSLDVYKSGDWNMVMGYPTQRTHYLSRNCLITSDPTNRVRNFSFENYSMVLYSIETLVGYSHNYDPLEWESKTTLGTYLWNLVWRANFAVRPAVGQLNTLVCKRAITLNTVKESILRLTTKQPEFYINLPYTWNGASGTITQAIVDGWNLANDRSFYTPEALTSKK